MDNRLWEIGSSGGGRGGTSLGLRFEGVDLNGVDAEAVHADDGVMASIEFEAVARPRDALKLGENESGEGFEAFIPGQADVMFRFEIADVDGAVQNNRGSAGCKHRLGYIKLIFNFANQQFQDVFNSNDAGS